MSFVPENELCLVKHKENYHGLIFCGWLVGGVKGLSESRLRRGSLTV